MPEQIPDATGYVRAWRCWRLIDGALVSITRPAVWPARRALVAHCDCPRPTLHDAPPEVSGICGIHGLKELWQVQSWRRQCQTSADPVVFGEVALFGRVALGTLGYRAQHARPLSLLASEEHDLGDVAELYGVSLVAWPEPTTRVGAPRERTVPKPAASTSTLLLRVLRWIRRIAGLILPIVLMMAACREKQSTPRLPAAPAVPATSTSTVIGPVAAGRLPASCADALAALAASNEAALRYALALQRVAAHAVEMAGDPAADLAPLRSELRESARLVEELERAGAEGSARVTQCLQDAGGAL